MLAAFLLALAVICGFGAATLLLLENSHVSWGLSDDCDLLSQRRYDL